jgi:Co/Zn/Cd efflux system component
MKPHFSMASWLRRGFEAGVVGAVLAIGTLAAMHLSRSGPRLLLPNGLDGALILMPAVASLGVFVVCYPIFLAATREDAILGAVAAFLIAADALGAISFALGGMIYVHPLSHAYPLGVVAAALAVPPALAGLAFGQLSTPLGFGRSAGLRAVLGGAVVGTLVVLAAAYTI